MHRSKLRLIAVLLAGALVVAACGGDDDDTASGDTTTTAAGDDAAGGISPAEGEGDEYGEGVEVTMFDYGYEGLPDSVAAGTTFTVRNDSAAELHEFVAVLLPEGEDRSVEELLQLPEEEIGALLGGGEPAAVLLAMPGSDETIPAVGTGTLDDPGRYIVACFIPQGADPNEYMAAAQESEGGPPQVEGGPPHFTLGMHAELTVE